VCTRPVNWPTCAADRKNAEHLAAYRHDVDPDKDGKADESTARGGGKAKATGKRKQRQHGGGAESDEGSLPAVELGP
jgi:hypothetical protein